VDSSTLFHARALLAREMKMTHDAETLVQRVRSVSDLPVAVGFGISTAEQVREIWRLADAAVVGSAIVSQIEKMTSSPDLVGRVGEFARSLLTSATTSRET
jgi:tryptophan synthase alpha chain